MPAAPALSRRSLTDPRKARIRGPFPLPAEFQPAPIRLAIFSSVSRIGSACKGSKAATA